MQIIKIKIQFTLKISSLEIKVQKGVYNMKWLDEGILLSTRPHGESNLIVTFLTKNHSLIKGYLRLNKKCPPIPGNLYHISYKARLTTHLGFLSIEQHDFFSVAIFSALQSPVKLACINAMRALMLQCLIDNDSTSEFDMFYPQVKKHIIEISLNSSFGHYPLFETNLLTHCGFGLDLMRCAVTNELQNLAYVSPKTGRAVTQATGAPYKQNLLKLPQFLTTHELDNVTLEEILTALNLSGFFLSRVLQETFHQKLPAERNYLITLFQKKASYAKNN